MASTYLTRTPSSNGSETKGTFSAWVKRTKLGDYHKMYTSYQASNEFLDIQFNNADQLAVTILIGGSTYLDLRTTRLFRDVNAFYNIVVVIDSTDSTQADRCKIYVNGVRETSFATNTNNISADLNCRINGTAQNVYVGSWHNGDYFEGLMSHVHWIDGTAYQASTFGSTDSTTGEWKINTNVTATYGTNGFFILKDGNSVTDQSGNSNNLTVAGGTLTNTEDNPSNVFCTLNPLIPIGANFSNGNLTHSTTSGGYKSSLTTLGVSSGKWYCEVKYTTDTGYTGIGVANFEKGNINSIGYLGDGTNSVSFFAGSQTLYYNGGNPSWTGASCANGDIIGIALDLDNGFIYWHKNGTYMNSGNPTSGATGTGGYALSNIANSDGTGNYAFGVSTAATGGTRTLTCNFGNGYFGTTAISSEGTNASGIGKFEYDVPTGYTALSTKGLNE